MKSFVYSYPTKNYFGVGCVKENLPGVLSAYGENVLLAYGSGSIKKNGVYKELMDILNTAGKKVTEFSGIMPNPIYKKVQEGAALAKEKRIDLIIAAGGGSVIDCCKIVSAQARLAQDIWEMEFTDHKFPAEYVPMIAIVTASGTGAEQNNGAVITHEKKKIKAGVLGAHADAAFLDPVYTLSLPMMQVMSGAFDTLSHCMETYFGSPEGNNLSDDICEAVMRSVIRNMRVLKNDPENMDSRSELEWASAMAENGILKIGKTSSFQAHQIEHQLGAYTDCNHGQGLAVIHPILYRRLCKDAPVKFARLAANVFGVCTEKKTEAETALEGIDCLAAFIREMGLPTTFAEMGIGEGTDYRSVADSSNIITNGCFQPLTHDDIYEILMDCRK
ncbi:MAG: iron-containing alcohol dehydrogenase [Lachnospiraceae bacterium]|nr:iron-containing alcohol dehydrogenase [Acetatifactor muris]MCM1218575.1 iron-containing alcohol dehydrogenase [Lachnospiraceae bacterium]